MREMPYEQVIMTIPEGKFLWDRVLQDIQYIPKGHRSAQFTLVLSVKENTKTGATAKVCRHLLKVIAERNKGTRPKVANVVNLPTAKWEL